MTERRTTEGQQPRLTFQEDGHKYLLNGKRATSVTTILGGGIPKPQLIDWAAREVATYATENPGADYETLSTAHRIKRDTAGIRGTVIHNIAEALLNGEAVEVADDVWPYVEGLVDFIREWKITPLHQECIVAHEKLNVAGKFDLVCTSPYLNSGQPILLDWKSSKKVYGETALQTAAYTLADFMVTPDGEEVPVPKITATYVVHIAPGESTIYPLATNRQEISDHFSLFLDALRVYRGATPRRKALKPALTHPNQKEAAA